MNKTVTYELARIRKQLEANLGYFAGNERETLSILQSHIKNSLDTLEYVNANVSSYGSWSFNADASEFLHDIMSKHYPNDGEYSNWDWLIISDDLDIGLRAAQGHSPFNVIVNVEVDGKFYILAYQPEHDLEEFLKVLDK